MSGNDATASTTADVLISSLSDAGVSTIFANFGSDHTDIIEALAKAQVSGNSAPSVVICPHEASAMGAAHGYALVTGMPQAVFVHVDVGTANLGGSVHNAARSRVPAFIFAGRTPYTLESELPGTRNIPTNYLQDVHNQQEILRPYVKWNYEIRTGRNVGQIVFRSLQIARSSPQGPVYVTGAREVLAEKVPPAPLAISQWSPVAPTAAPPDVIERLIGDLVAADCPIIVTSYLGRNQQAVQQLVELAEALGIGVVEAGPSHLNFPADHPLHLGYSADDLLRKADVILVLDADVPWMNSRLTPKPGSTVYFCDVDPLKQDLPLWYMPSDHFIRTDSPLLLTQILSALPLLAENAADTVAERSQHFAQIHRAQRKAWKTAVNAGEGSITPEFVCETVSSIIDSDTIVLNEAITNSENVYRHIPRTRPGTRYANGGSSLGWSGGAALGIKLALPDATIVSLVGDGSYFLSVPSSTYWIAQQYSLPFLTVVLDNGGWNATKQNLVKQYPAGVADETDQYWVNLGQSADLAGIASAAGGAFAATVTSADTLRSTLLAALNRVKGGQAAVVHVRIAAISNQSNADL